jgi:hypothetical protein
VRTSAPSLWFVNVHRWLRSSVLHIFSAFFVLPHVCSMFKKWKSVYLHYVAFACFCFDDFFFHLLKVWMHNGCKISWLIFWRGPVWIMTNKIMNEVLVAFLSVSYMSDRKLPSI